MDGEGTGGDPLDQVGFLLSRVGTAVQAGFKAVLAEWSIRPLHFHVLNALGAGVGPSQQEVCSALHIDSGNMVELLDVLEARQYAQRAPDPNDRRRHVVTLTAAGRVALGEIMQAVREYDRQFFAPLDTSECAQLVGLLGKLYAATAEGRGGPFAVAT